MRFDLQRYTIRRKVLKIFGASFQVLDDSGTVVGFSSQKAFKLKEDIRVYSDESQRTELLTIQARQVIDFSAAYNVVDSADGSKVGAARRKGWTSLVRDSWELLDTSDRPIGKLQEDSTVMALARRFLSDLIPQSFHLEDTNGRAQASFHQHFNPFVYRLTVALEPGATIDPRLVFATAVLIAAVEGRQN